MEKCWLKFCSCSFTNLKWNRVHNRRIKNKEPLQRFTNNLFRSRKLSFRNCLEKNVVGLNTNFCVFIAGRIKKHLWAAGGGQSWPPRPPATWLQHLRPENLASEEQQQQQAEASALFQPLAFYTSAGPTEDKM